MPFRIAKHIVPTGLEHLLPHVVPFALVLARLGGLFVFAPLISSIVVPMRIKVMFVLAFACAVYPMTPSLMTPAVDIDVLSLAPLMVMEVAIGVVIGVLAAVPLLALEMSGVLIGQQMGFGLAKVFNPEVDFDTDLIGQVLFYIASGAYLAAGGVETVFGTVVETFGKVPIGGFAASEAPLDVLVGVVTAGFQLAWRVAAPVTATILLLITVMGIVGKTMPQINIMSVGFTAKVLAGLGMLSASIYAMHTPVWDYVVESLHEVIRWAGSIAGVVVI